MMKLNNVTINNANVKMQYINTNRAEIGEDISTPKRGGKCICCKEMTTYYRCKLPSTKKYICYDCAEMLQSYYFEDFRKAYFTVHGIEMCSVEIEDKISIGLELETIGNSLDAKMYLIDNGYIPTSDSTVSIEYKSPIYNNLSAITKVCGKIEQMDKDRNIDFSVNNQHCGLHTHFGYNNESLQSELKTFYSELFRPIDKYVRSLTSEQRLAIFGSDFRYYANKIDFDYPLAHCNWINIQHDKTIEVRLFRFTSATQYTKAVKVFRAMFDFYFANKSNLTDEKARIIGQKMVVIFKRNYKDIL